MTHEILLRALQLGESDEAFALVVVTNTEGPTAVKTGNKSIIRSDGTIEGWVGGHCTEDEIVRTALESIREGTMRALKVPTCQGGTMDVYVEPYMPRRKLVVLGHVPIVGALSQLAKILNFFVVVVDGDASKEKFPKADLVLKTSNELQRVRLTSQTYVVIATMGESDHESVRKLVGSEVPYIGIVAGKKRAGEILAFLSSEGISEEQISKVRSPAGINVRAVTAEEIALSIMAQIVELSRTQNRDLGEQRGRTVGKDLSSAEEPTMVLAERAESGERVVVDPVCGMTVDAVQSKYHSEIDERKIAFCSSGCKKDFDKNPTKYLLGQRA